MLVFLLNSSEISIFFLCNVYFDPSNCREVTICFSFILCSRTARVKAFSLFYLMILWHLINVIMKSKYEKNIYV